MKKKLTAILALALLVTLVACDEEDENATIVIFSELTNTVIELSLTGTEDTGNLLAAGVTIVPGDMFPLQDNVLPGKYTWHVSYDASTSLADHYDSPVEIELFPGRNNLLLSESLGGL